MTRKLPLCLVLFLFSFLSHANLTTRYYETWNDADSLFDEALAKLKGYRIVLVPGFLSDAIIDLGPWGLRATRLGEYYDAQMTWLKSDAVGLDVVRVDHNVFAEWDSENSVSKNAGVIADVIRQSQKPVLIISHSKGGLDTLEMLLRHPELREKVKGWAALQAPFHGSPIADCVSDQAGLSTLAFELLKLLGGTQNSLLDLRTDIRARYMADNAKHIKEVTNAVPVISIASVKKDESFLWDTLLEPFRNAMDEKGLENDGLVPLQSTELSGAEQVTIRSHDSAPFGIDHAVMVMECKFISFDRIRFMKTILNMLSRHL